MNKNFIFCIAIAIVLNLSSCGTQYLANNEEGTTTNSVVGLELHEEISIPLDMTHTWKLKTLRSNEKESFIKIVHTDKTPTLEIRNDGRIDGYDGCNSFRSKIVAIDNNKIKFSGFLGTNRGCHPSVYWYNKFYNAIGSVNNYTLQNGELSLKKDSHTLIIFSKIR